MDAGYVIRRRRERRFSRRILLDDIPDDVFVSRYRLSKAGVRRVIELVRQDLQAQTIRGRAISVETKVLISLRFLAKGNIYSELADIHGISRSSVSRILHSFVRAVNRRMINIRFPVDQEDQTIVKVGFLRLCGIPNVLGAVDGTLIPIVAPKEHEEVYVCRKGYHALNVQGIVDSRLRFLNVVSTYPGSSHDSFVFDGCGVKDYLERNDVGHLLADSGYSLRRYCLTPFAATQNPQQMRYNNARTRGRVVVERAFGVLKKQI